MKSKKFALPIGILFLILVASILVKKNNRDLQLFGVDTTVEIINIFRKTKGLTNSETIAVVKYKTQSGIVEQWVPLQPKMKIGKCYQIR